MRFSDFLRAANKPLLDNFHSWVFQSGMTFKSPKKWWGDRGYRDFPHEGVDFCLYKTPTGETLQLNHRTNIPAISDGIVKQIFPDYLGQAVVVEHETIDRDKITTISIYAHTNPTTQLHAGVCIKKGDVIATIADTRQSKVPIHPHLHYTFGRAISAIDYEQFVWNDMRNPNLVLLINPLSVMSDKYE
jgi:murein DD-endopeptidase MepM/ murein hydrolase activator NlpD